MGVIGCKIGNQGVVIAGETNMQQRKMTTIQTSNLQENG